MSPDVKPVVADLLKFWDVCAGGWGVWVRATLGHLAL